MSETEHLPATPPSSLGTGPRRSLVWWIVGAIALVAVLMIAAVMITAIVVDGSDDDRETELIDQRDVISRDRAERLALDEVGAGSVTEIELDNEDGRLVYEIEVSDPSRPGIDIDVVVDARTGEIVYSEA